MHPTLLRVYLRLPLRWRRIVDYYRNWDAVKGQLKGRYPRGRVQIQEKSNIREDLVMRIVRSGEEK